jgi:hypothetical protein
MSYSIASSAVASSECKRLPCLDEELCICSGNDFWQFRPKRSPKTLQRGKFRAEGVTLDLTDFG